MKIWKLVAAATLALALSACSMLGPNLNNGNTFFEQYGSSIMIQSALWSTGSPFKGVRVELKGDVFSKHLLGTPKDATLEFSDQFMQKTIKKQVSFIQSGPDAMQATLSGVDVDKPSVVAFLEIPAMRPGTGDLTLSISSVDPADKAQIRFFLPITIYERELGVQRRDFFMSSNKGAIHVEPMK